MLRKLLTASLFLLTAWCYADTQRNQFAVNNLCQNLTRACNVGEQSSCQAAKDSGCACDESQGTCTRGNYSTH